MTRIDQRNSSGKPILIICLEIIEKITKSGKQNLAGKSLAKQYMQLKHANRKMGLLDH